MPALLLLVLLGHASAKDFLSSNVQVDSAYINMVIQGALDGVLGSGHSVDQERLTSINATLAPLFNALPKNQFGRLDSPSMRYAVQRYFSQRHGWVVKGFEPHAVNGSSVASGHIVHGKIPGYIEAVLKTTLSKGGFALPDIVVLVSSTEVLIFDENLKGLEASYRLNGMEMGGFSSLGDLSAILTSYFIIVHLNGASESVELHQADKLHIVEVYPHWGASKSFMVDIVGDDAFQRAHLANPFLERRSFAFEDVARITRTVSERFGPFSNHECHDMKVKIAELDPHETGRVKLADFYRAALEPGFAYQFFEASEYLDLIGALDSSSPTLGPQVIIPNYITAVNNCISTSAYYDICCLNECDAIYQHLEARFQGPTASAAEILQSIEEGITLSPLLSSTAPTEPRNLSAPMLDRLTQVALHHDGQVPLHGRLFGQWLHFAFPRECPYPHMSGTVGRHSMQSVQQHGLLNRTTVSDTEMIMHMKSEAGRSAPSPMAGVTMWTSDEELLAPVRNATWAPSLRSVMLITMLVSLSVLVKKELSRILNFGGADRKGHAKTEVSYNV